MSINPTITIANVNGNSPSIKAYFVALVIMMLMATAVKTALEIVLVKLHMNIFFFILFMITISSKESYFSSGNPNTLLAFCLASSTSPSPLILLA